MALWYHDAQFFADMARKGETIPLAGQELPTVDWLEEQILNITPAFCAEVREMSRRKASSRQTEKPR
jgi:hypothetical protein